MPEKSTRDDFMEISEETRRFVLRMIPKEELLDGLSPKERLAGLGPKERLAGLSPKERLAGLSPRERLVGLTIEQRRLLLRFLQKEMDIASGDTVNNEEVAAEPTD